jgi:hypothetical protein
MNVKRIAISLLPGVPLISLSIIWVASGKDLIEALMPLFPAAFAIMGMYAILLLDAKVNGGNSFTGPM